MKQKPGEYIYVYDSESHKIIIIDGETGERVNKKDDRVSSILDYLADQGRNEKLRKFAVWCAHQTNQKIKPIQNKIFELAERAIEGVADAEELNRLYEETEGTAIATDTVGLQHGAKNAPAFLASRECINPDPYEGALQAARFHSLWAEMNEEEEKDSPFLRDIRVSNGDERIQQAQQQQIDYLLELINDETRSARPAENM